MLNHSQLARADLNLLLLFDLLFEEGNAGRAAARLNLSPSAVSHALRRLRRLFDDPLFLPSPRGMVATDRARELAPEIRHIAESIGEVLASIQPFDPATSTRRFTIGAPDAAVSILVPSLVARLSKDAPGMDLSILQLLPRPGSGDPEHAWHDALAELDSGRLDVVILPYHPPASRFTVVPLYFEDFVIATALGHAFAKSPSIDRLAAARHVLVSATGDQSGFVDLLLADRGHERRVALTVPSFFMATAAIASSDLIGAIPRRFAHQAAQSYEIEIVEPPFEMGSADLNAIVPSAAMLDRGVNWLLEAVGACLTPPR